MKKEKGEGERLKVLDKYCKMAKRKGYHPTLPEMKAVGVTREKIRHHFGSHSKLKTTAKLHDPETFKGILDESVFTRKAFEQLLGDAGKFNRFVLTTAVAGCKVHDGFFKAINYYCEVNNAMLIVLPCMDPAANVPFYLDPKLADTALLVDDLALNDNIFVSSIRLSAKHIDPVTGLNRIGQRNGSFIYASPKQRLKLTPTSNVKLPHAIMTTGALTKPNYNTDRYMSERTAYIAEHDHVLGALVVEIEDDQTFHFRQVQADSKGSFIDLGVMYGADQSIKEVQPEALVLGDWHSGETDDAAAEQFIGSHIDSVASRLKPKRLVIHDGFNGRSISHHEVHNKTLRAQRAIANQLSLGVELSGYRTDLEYMTSRSYVEEVVIVKSNHDEHLDRYLAEARYIEDPQNYALSLELALAAVYGQSPLQAFMQKRGLKGAHKLRWLTRDEDYKVAGIELGAHGDKGANGARGSLHAMENAYVNSVSGHSHTPEILRGAWQVGTTSLLKLNYNTGPSSWLHTGCLIYPNGSRQLINVINGKWRLND